VPQWHKPTDPRARMQQQRLGGYIFSGRLTKKLSFATNGIKLGNEELGV